MARPSKGGDDKRGLIVRVRVTAAEKITLEERAAGAGLTPSDFIRVRTIGSAPFIRKATPEREAFIRGLAQLGKIGSNVNQIAHSLNRKDGSVTNELIDDALHGVHLLTTSLLNLLDYN